MHTKIVTNTNTAIPKKKVTKIKLKPKKTGNKYNLTIL